jgi:predicted amidohydrolase
MLLIVLLPGVLAFLPPRFITIPLPRHMLSDRSPMSDVMLASPKKTVRVAAIQVYSQMGKISANRRLLTGMITRAAAEGAKIVVLPECAAHGYLQPVSGTKWSDHADEDNGELAVQDVAESVTGSTKTYFAALAKKLQIYLTVPFIEIDGGCGKFYNSALLIDPNGQVVAHHRKASLWTEGDGLWATKAPPVCKPVSTPYGRLGLMICHDVHVMPPVLKRAGVDIVLYCVGWYGPNTENWYREIFPMRYVVPNKFSVIAANWARDPDSDPWHGCGYSCVINAAGKVVAMAQSPESAEIVIADLPIGPAPILPPPLASPEDE